MHPAGALRTRHCTASAVPGRGPGVASDGVAIAGAKYHFVALSSEVYSIDYLPFAPRAIDGVLVAVVALFISFVATLYPSWSAARVLPAEALRYE